MIDIQHFKQKLIDEKTKIESELGNIGRINPSNPQDWEAKPAQMDIMNSDKNEKADAMEEFEINSAIEVPLEDRLNNIKSALERIEGGTYGLCSVDGKEIEEDRLEANPAANTCKEHINN
jgi:RNA polymerase-binding transcription factor DksA